MTNRKEKLEAWYEINNEWWLDNYKKDKSIHEWVNKELEKCQEPKESSVCTCKNPEAYVYWKGSTHFYCCNMCDKQIAGEEPKEDNELLGIIEAIWQNSFEDINILINLKLVQKALRLINKKINNG